ncbi:MAG: hypothetical protein L6V78_07850 [Clostridium sp.]|nr:MAG: hypothetical protein L6V78_07850 [Clostridium sp.]
MIKLPKYAIIVVIKGVFIMEVINLSSRSFKGLRTLELPNTVYNTEVKIKYLKDIGTILEKMDEVRKYAELEDFYLNDLHEGNFIVDEEGTLRVIDLDSCKIAGNMPFLF